MFAQFSGIVFCIFLVSLLFFKHVEIFSKLFESIYFYLLLINDGCLTRRMAV